MTKPLIHRCNSGKRWRAIEQHGDIIEWRLVNVFGLAVRVRGERIEMYSEGFCEDTARRRLLSDGLVDMTFLERNREYVEYLNSAQSARAARIREEQIVEMESIRLEQKSREAEPVSESIKDKYKRYCFAVNEHKVKPVDECDTVTALALARDGMTGDLTSKPMTVQSSEFGGTIISTMFIATDARESSPRLNLQDIPQPLVFCTVVVGGCNDGLRVFYSSYDQAVMGHSSVECIAQMEQSESFTTRTGRIASAQYHEKRLLELVHDEIAPGLTIHDISRRAEYEELYEPPVHKPIKMPLLGFTGDELEYMNLGTDE